MANARQFIGLGVPLVLVAPFTQVTQLLVAVQSKLKITNTPEEKLKIFIDILNKNPALVELVGQLTAAYESYGGTAFQSSSSASGSSSNADGSSSTGADTQPGVSSATGQNDTAQVDKVGGAYKRVSLKRDHFLVNNVTPERLASWRLEQKLIGEDIRDQAFVSYLPNMEKIRRMIHAVITRIELNAANYMKFIDVLKQDGSFGDLIQFIEN